MLAPIPWLKNYTKIELPLTELMWRMTEVGMTTESYEKQGDEIILDVEVTPNRPDWLSIQGIAREVAALQNSKFKPLKIPDIPTKKADLPIKVESNVELCPMYVGITLKDITIKDSPKYIQDRLKLMGLRPINNIVDITNYVMLETGNPVHAFDYDKLDGVLKMSQAKGGEVFVSVDGKEYTLPKGAVVIKVGKRIIDLCGIKGGENTGISNATKNVFIHVPVYTPKYIRKTSTLLGLRSEASYIYERGADPGGAINALKFTVDLILKNGSGKVASRVIQQPTGDVKPKSLTLDIDKLQKFLGLDISSSKATTYLSRLQLSPKIISGKIVCTIPTYRLDLNIEEDLIEEVARIHGYNAFPKTLPSGKVSGTKVPFSHEYGFEKELKHLLIASGFSEVYTFSLVSESQLLQMGLKPNEHIRLANPISREYKYLQQTLLGSLIAAAANNPVKELRLFEYGKVYLGDPDKPLEQYRFSGIAKGQKFRHFKGVLDLILERLNINNVAYGEASNPWWDSQRSGQISVDGKVLGSFGYVSGKVSQAFNIKDELLAFEFDVASVKSASRPIVFEEIPKYPAQIEDLTMQIPASVRVGKVVNTMNESSKNVVKVELVDIFENSYTFRIWYQDPHKTLTNIEVNTIREKLISKLQKQFGVQLN